jgi:hypothetical protein
MRKEREKKVNVFMLLPFYFSLAFKTRQKALRPDRRSDLTHPASRRCRHRSLRLRGIWAIEAVDLGHRWWEGFAPILRDLFSAFRVKVCKGDV